VTDARGAGNGRWSASARCSARPPGRATASSARCSARPPRARDRLLVELDGFASHATRRGFERDRARDRALQTAGWRVVRITWRQLHDSAGEVAADLESLLKHEPVSANAPTPDIGSGRQRDSDPRPTRPA
jgi:hypothetical protein